jgi:hypothetical protein
MHARVVSLRKSSVSDHCILALFYGLGAADSQYGWSVAIWVVGRPAAVLRRSGLMPRVLGPALVLRVCWTVGECCLMTSSFAVQEFHEA